jgi:hypothetical protein
MYKVRMVKGKPAVGKETINRVGRHRWFPDRLSKDYRDAVFNVLDADIAHARAKKLNLSLSGYYKMIGDFLRSEGMEQEAWICEMFRHKQFRTLFANRPSRDSVTFQRKASAYRRSETEKVWDSMGHIIAASDALEFFRRYHLEPAITATHKSKLSTGEIARARQRFHELTTSSEPMSANQAYKRVARELTKPRRRVHHTTVRRVCDDKFAEQSNCNYGMKPKRKDKRPQYAFLNLAIKKMKQRSRHVQRESPRACA